MSKVIVGMVLAAILSAVVGSSVVSAATLNEELDSLFVIASSAEIQHQDQRDPAMDRIASYGAEAVPYLVDKFSTQSAWERWTVLWIFQRIGATAIPGLLQALNRSEGEVVERVCWALGDVGDSTAVDGLTAVTNHTRWQVRDQALQALGKIGDVRASEVVQHGLVDTVGQVRKSAAVACGKLDVEAAIDGLVDMLGDSFYGARLMAIDALLKLDTASVLASVTAAFDAPDPRVGNLACVLLGKIGTDDAMKILLTQLDSPDPIRHAHAALGLVEADPQDNCRYRDRYYNDQTDRLLKIKIESAIGMYDDEIGSP